ncbi:hypothetical protein CLV62_1015 [Dysgonomonas alginatilytica]|uniref:Uncharacterized protein n=1 Tax=Dysgonomonas alginatilytica TaxID=1605892 RepID=A0A2V3PT02_9BACT|nr:hypothetical protein [Dysgonomonas alginatilytica]PXV68743.1 hypothetical protein CLV62_1015 [Dysgonomonas alginatilytica]
MEQTKFRREELYNLVWKETASKLSIRFNITTIDLKRICEKLAIPQPKNDYWTKIKFGKQVIQTPLPDFSGKIIEVDFNNLESFNDEDISTRAKIRQKEKEVLKDKRINLKVPQTVKNPIPSIQKFKQPEYRISSFGDFLAIRTSKPLESRALSIMDTFIKAVEIRGHKVMHKNGETYFYYESNTRYWCTISLIEKSDQQISNDASWTRHNLVYNGKLSFRYGMFSVYKEWIDSTETLIEERLGHIIAFLEVKGENDKLERMAQDAKQAIADQERLVEKEYEARKKEELKKFKELFSLADRLHKTKILRSYIDEYLVNIEKHNLWTKESLEWVAWAKSKIDWYDPFIEAEDDVLKNIDRSIF